MAQNKPFITVTGATGSQGGAVVQAILKRGKFRVRAVTRNPESSAAKALASQGCEVVKADMTDEASLVKVAACLVIATYNPKILQACVTRHMSQ